MSLHSVPLFSFDFLPSRPVEIEVSPAPLTSDAGLLPVRQFDQHIRLTEQFAAALDDRRDPTLTRQSLLSMVRQRIYGILADYEDQNDHDTLRSDPVFKLLADRLPDGPDLASQPTLSRFENAVSIPDLWRLRDVLVDLFIQSFDTPPRHLTLDIDAFDDPAHGQQQLIMFHGYYEQYQYLPIAITCAENDMVLLVGLRHGTCHASLGADNDLRYLMGRLRAVWPDVQIHVRGDSGLGVPLMYDVCRELRLTYTFGIGMNSRLRAISDDLLKQALEEYERDRPAAAVVPVGRLSGGELAGAAAGRHQGGSACPRDQPTGRGHEPARLPGPSACGLRRVRHAGREREPEQGAEDRTACRPPQRPPVPGELLPALPARGRVEPAGAVAPRGRPILTHVRRAGPAGRVADRSARRAGSQEVLQQAA